MGRRGLCGARRADGHLPGPRRRRRQPGAEVRRSPHPAQAGLQLPGRAVRPEADEGGCPHRPEAGGQPTVREAPGGAHRTGGSRPGVGRQPGRLDDEDGGHEPPHLRHLQDGAGVGRHGRRGPVRAGARPGRPARRRRLHHARLHTRQHERDDAHDRRARLGLHPVGDVGRPRLLLQPDGVAEHADALDLRLHHVPRRERDRGAHVAGRDDVARLEGQPLGGLRHHVLYGEPEVLRVTALHLLAVEAKAQTHRVRVGKLVAWDYPRAHRRAGVEGLRHGVVDAPHGHVVEDSVTPDVVLDALLGDAPPALSYDHGELRTVDDGVRVVVLRQHDPLVGADDDLVQLVEGRGLGVGLEAADDHVAHEDPAHADDLGGGGDRGFQLGALQAARERPARDGGAVGQAARPLQRPARLGERLVAPRQEGVQASRRHDAGHAEWVGDPLPVQPGGAAQVQVVDPVLVHRSDPRPVIRLVHADPQLLHLPADLP